SEAFQYVTLFPFLSVTKRRRGLPHLHLWRLLDGQSAGQTMLTGWRYRVHLAHVAGCWTWRRGASLVWRCGVDQQWNVDAVDQISVPERGFYLRVRLLLSSC